MDQDSFRQLLASGPSTPKASASNALGGATRKRSSIPVPQQSSLKTKPEASGTAPFQPRKVKKANPNANYRDRAAERRIGADHEFTHVETLLNDFEERNKGRDQSLIDEQRKYLGGDSEHSVLVKGLDFALLEQNKAKVAAISSVEDDEALEQAFLGVDGGTSTDAIESASEPKKKSRQDLIRELKEKRGQDTPAEAESKASDTGIEEAKKAGKFKPIGFKPIGGASEGKKRKKEKEGGEKKKKKRKVEEAKDKPAEASGSTQPSAPSLPTAFHRKEKQPEPEPDSTDPDFDIFAGVEEYTGEIEDDSEDEDKHPGAEGSPEPRQDVDQPGTGRWFDEPKPPTPPPKEPTPPPVKEPLETREELEEEPVPMRLAPLASSISAKDILAVDDAVAKAEKRKARKEKKKKQVELNTQEKVNRDYQKLMAYEQKKSK